MTSFDAISSVHNDDVKALSSFVDSGGDVNSRDEDGCTLLHHAAFGGSVETTKFLLDRNADVFAKNVSGNQATHYAANGGFSGVLRLLLERGGRADVANHHDTRPLKAAIFKGHTACVRILMEHGAGAATESSSASPLPPLRFHLSVGHETQAEITRLLAEAVMTGTSAAGVVGAAAGATASSLLVPAAGGEGADDAKHEGPSQAPEGDTATRVDGTAAASGVGRRSRTRGGRPSQPLPPALAATAAGTGGAAGMPAAAAVTASSGAERTTAGSQHAPPEAEVAMEVGGAAAAVPAPCSLASALQPRAASGAMDTETVVDEAPASPFEAADRAESEADTNSANRYIDDNARVGLLLNVPPAAAERAVPEPSLPHPIAQSSMPSPAATVVPPPPPTPVAVPPGALAAVPGDDGRADGNVEVEREISSLLA
ncbi:unnamed protein product, partial [Phaeothamnion confervicola]